MRKKLVAGAAVLTLLMNSPQVKADDDIVIFGGEFGDEAAPTKPKKVEKPAPKPPAKKPIAEPEVVKPKDKPPTQPIKQPEADDENFDDVLIFDDLNRVPPKSKRASEKQPVADKPDQSAPVEQPIAEPKPTAPVEQPIMDNKPPAQPLEQPEDSTQNSPKENSKSLHEESEEIIDTFTKTPLQTQEPIIDESTNSTPIEQPTVEPLPATEPEQSFERPTNIYGGQEPAVEPNVTIPPTTTPTVTDKSEHQYFPSRNVTPPQTELKMLKPRFLKLAVDDTYIYYLDKSSVQWKRIPYMANEYMADVWVRMIEREPKNLDDDMAYYGAENFRAEVALALEKGYQYPPEDLKVLRSQAYVLEHYYLRPKTKQIQFLCELEVFGRPQNAINERAYDYKNWENLVPGSIESAIYDATIKIIGKSKASERGHMTFFDMLDEYGRIALN